MSRQSVGPTQAFCARCGLAIAVAVITMIRVALTDDLPQQSGTVGEAAEVPSFYVRAVTGPLAGKSVCYVCRNGDRPVVLVLLRELGTETTALLKDLDQTVNKHRAKGLRCFAVLLTDTPQRDLATLQTLAFDEKIEIPLAMATDAATTGTQLEFPRDCAVSIITYESRHVVARYSFKPGDCTGSARSSVVAAAEKLLK